MISHEDMFQLFIRLEGSVNFVLFSAPWCPYCQVLKPIWNKVASSRYDRAFLAEVSTMFCWSVVTFVYVFIAKSLLRV